MRIIDKFMSAMLVVLMVIVATGAGAAASLFCSTSYSKVAVWIIVTAALSIAFGWVASLLPDKWKMQ